MHQESSLALFARCSRSILEPALAVRGRVRVVAFIAILGVVGLGVWMAHPATASTGSSPADWMVSEDTVLTNQPRNVNGTLHVQDNATLHLEGVDLRVGERIQVAQNASLVIGPSNGTATTLAPTNESEGFEIQIRGTLSTSGTPPTRIEGLVGAGLLTVASPVGGLQVHGDASLSDVSIQNGSGPVIVREGAHAVLDNVTVQDLGELGIASLGHLELSQSRVLDHAFGVFGRHDRMYDACTIHARDLVVRSNKTNVMLNACRFEGVDTTVEGGNLGATLNGRSTLVLQDSLVAGYRDRGVATQPLPSGPPRLDVRNVRLEPGSGATHGLHLLESPRAVLTNVTASGHAEVGVAAGGTNLTVTASTFEDNGASGIQSRGGALTLGAGNTFGSLADGTANGQAAVHRVVRFPAVLLGPDDEAVAGLGLTVRPVDGGSPLVGIEDAPANPVTVEFESYEGREEPRYVGPFVYEALHPRLDGSQQGEVPEDGSALVLRAGDPAGGQPIGLPVPSLGASAGVLLAVVALAAVARRRWADPKP